MDKVIIILLVYVNDILIIRNTDVHLERFIITLQKLFTIKDLGRLHYLLGLETIFSKNDMYIMKKTNK